ncbi:hypothetical protein N0V94_003073 [Neodidymelliopsis sp. IMI 364377]|nr:hypothetical protein N0V94_003073 [Neodidymelliopsis sp. IMI 364377]
MLYDELRSLSAIHQIYRFLCEDAVKAEVSRLRECAKERSYENLKRWVASPGNLEKTRVYIKKYASSEKGKATKKEYERKRKAGPETAAIDAERTRERERKYAKTEKNKARVERYEQSLKTDEAKREEYLMKKRARYAKKMAVQGQPYKPRGQHKR